MPLNLIWLEQATHPVVLEAGDAAAEPALRSFDVAGSLGRRHAREEWWADQLVVPPLGPQTNSSSCFQSFGGGDADWRGAAWYANLAWATARRRVRGRALGHARHPRGPPRRRRCRGGVRRRPFAGAPVGRGRPTSGRRGRLRPLPVTAQALVRRPRLRLSEHPALPVGGGDRGVVREERRAPRRGPDAAADVGSVEGVVRRPALAQLQGQDGREGGYDPRAPRARGRVLAAVISRPTSSREPSAPAWPALGPANRRSDGLDASARGGYYVAVLPGRRSG
jgi:hypothetical protein